MDNLTMLPMDWKPLREAAEASAREVYAIEDEEWHRLRMEGGRTRDIRMAFDMLPRLERESRIAAHALLLADLTRPASRDFWARWLAERVGLPEGATAPRWYRDRMSIGWVWVLEYSAHLNTHRIVFGESADGWRADIAVQYLRVVPGISALTNPAAALRAALLAVVPA